MKADYTHAIRAIGRLNTTAIEEEADGVGCFALSLTEGVHQLLQGCCALDLEENLIVIVSDFNVEMFAGVAFGLLGSTGASIFIRSRHRGGR